QVLARGGNLEPHRVGVLAPDGAAGDAAAAAGRQPRRRGDRQRVGPPVLHGAATRERATRAVPVLLGDVVALHDVPRGADRLGTAGEAGGGGDGGGGGGQPPRHRAPPGRR